MRPIEDEHHDGAVDVKTTNQECAHDSCLYHVTVPWYHNTQSQNKNMHMLCADLPTDAIKAAGEIREAFIFVLLSK